MIFNVDSLKKLKHIHFIFKYNMNYMYSYSTLVYFYNEYSDSFLENSFLACRRNSDTKDVDELYDYTEFINKAIETNMSVRDLSSTLGVWAENFAKAIDMSTCSVEQIQNIIDANTNALTRLNDYIKERKMLEDIESV